MPPSQESDDREAIRAVAPPTITHVGEIFAIEHQKVQLPNGREITLERAERPPGVRVIVNRGRSVLLAREWRRELDTWDYRLPGGKVFDDIRSFLSIRRNQSEILMQCFHAAKKELEEEIGVVVSESDLRYVCTSTCGATVGWDLLYFSVDVRPDWSPRGPIATNEGERVTAAFFSRREIVRLFRSGMLREHRSAAVLLRFLLEQR